MAITHYEHHGEFVAVQDHLKGLHREHCLCFQGCRFFKPESTENCNVAERVYRTCVDFGIVTPVWECPYFAKA